MKIYYYNAGQMTKMAAKSIHGNYPSTFFFTGAGGQISKICSIWGICPIIICSKYVSVLTLTCFMTMSNFVNQAFLYKKCKQLFF